jgi:dynein heavy chain
LTITLLEGAKEAAQYVKFLKLLQNPCDQLASLDVADMPSVMMQFLNCIRLIHLHSTNYGTIERITDLIRRVSSEIIEHCSNKISLDDIFYGDHLKAKKLLLDCIECGNIWKQTYNRMVITVNKQKEQNGSALESWKLSDPSIFAEIDAFAQRCDDLIDICDNRFQFMELLCSKVFLQSPDGRIVGRANGSAIENSITMIQDGFKNQIERLSTLDYCILNVRESRWYADYSTFKFAVKVSLFDDDY